MVMHACTPDVCEIFRHRLEGVELGKPDVGT
jgi:hypothetical protein